VVCNVTIARPLVIERLLSGDSRQRVIEVRRAAWFIYRFYAASAIKPRKLSRMVPTQNCASEACQRCQRARHRRARTISFASLRVPTMRNLTSLSFWMRTAWSEET